MRISSLGGRRSMAIARETCDRVIAYIRSHPAKTAIEYANETLVAEVAVNLIIGRFLLPEARAGRIAVPPRGRRPEWFAHVSDPMRVPVREPVRRAAKPICGITDPQLRADYVALVSEYNKATVHRLSPARRQQAQATFTARVTHVSDAHQDTIDRSEAHVLRIEREMQQLRDAVQLLASAVTSQSVIKTHA